jgi:hypothetical protein
VVGVLFDGEPPRDLHAQGAVAGHDGGAEAIHHRGEHLGPRLLQLTRDGIRVDDHRAPLGEQRRDRRLAGSDPAGETDEAHAGTVVGGA